MGCWDLLDCCKMKTLMMLSPSVKTTYLKIFQFSRNLRKIKENNLKMSLVLDLGQFASFGRRDVSFGKAADHPATFTKINVPPLVFLCFIIDFLEISFQDCFGHYSVKCYVCEKVQLLLYGSKSHWPVRLHDFFECSFSLTTWLFRMIIIDIPRVLEVFPVVLELEQETLLLVIVYCIPGPLGTFINNVILLINELPTQHRILIG